MKELTQEEKRLRIAKAFPKVFRNYHGRWQYSDGVYWFNCKDNDPFEDLNAMHEAVEKALIHPIACGGKSLLVPFCEHLERIAEDKESAMVATAAQRAEAFGKTLNLW